MDFLCLTETWHEDANSPSLLSVSPSSYSSIELARFPAKPFSSSHSSISLSYKSSFFASDICYFSISLFECLFSSFKSLSNFTFVIAITYRPPTSSLPLFLEEFSVSTETPYMHSSPFFIFRDFNISHNNKLNPYSLKLDNIFDLFNLTQHVNFSTHTAGNTLDYIVFSSFTKPSISAESVTFSDHSLNKSSFTILYFPISHFKINKRPWSKFNKDSFINSFSQSTFEPLSFSDSNFFLTAFNDSFLENLDAVLPTKTSFRLSSFKAPWFDIQRLSAERAVRKFERL